MNTFASLVYRLDRVARKIELPIVDMEAFDVTRSWTMTEAAKRMQGRRRYVLADPTNPHSERIQVRHTALNVARRWANPKKGWTVVIEGETFTLTLPAVKVSGEVLTMPEWVEAFEKARTRLGVRESAAIGAAAKLRG